MVLLFQPTGQFERQVHFGGHLLALVASHSGALPSHQRAHRISPKETIVKEEHLNLWTSSLKFKQSEVLCGCVLDFIRYFA